MTHGTMRVSEPSDGDPADDLRTFPEAERPYWRVTRDGRVELAGISSRRLAFNQHLIRTVETNAAWLRRHWLLLLNLLLEAFVGVALLVPVLYAMGAVSVARRIFLAYHVACDQIPSHSYYFFGYQLALCQRNLAIYGSLLAGTLAFRYARHWLPPLDWRLWLLTLLPMALDGGTQLFGWRESNWELRALTGVIFGLGVCWFVLPYLEGTVDGVRRSRPTVTLSLRFLRPLLTPRRQGVEA